MNIKSKSILLLLWLIIGLFAFAGCGAGTLTYDNVDEHIKEVAGTVKSAAAEPTVSSTAGEWAVLGLIISGQGNRELYDRYYENLQATLKATEGRLSENKYTDYARVAICTRALGKSPLNINGYNLLAPLDEKAKVSEQGINGPIFALIASSVCRIPLINEEAYINEVIAWLYKEDAKTSVDLTAMALQGLSFFVGRENVDKAVETGLQYLAEKQEKDGGYETCEATCQVIIALTCLKKNPFADKAFIKGDNNLSHGLMKFRKKRGFVHKAGDSEINDMATEQGLLALCAIKLYKEGRGIFERVVV